jgi:nitrogen fixation/metabolism regulation signal transduction histidine kinase
VAVLPGALVYALSVQFMARSIDTWFDVRVERALEGGLALGRNTLDNMLRDLRGKADTMALALSDRTPVQQARILNSLREQAAVQGASVLDASGRVLAFSHEDETVMVPEMPSPSQLAVLRLQKSYSGIVARPAGGLLLRVIVPVNTMGGELEALQLVQRVPEKIARDAEAVQDAYGEYQELSLSRLGLKRLYGLTLTLALLLALFSALLLAILFSQKLSAPLGVLAEGTRAVAQGDFSQRTPVRSYDELGILTQSFNSMTRELREAQRDSQRYAQQLETAKASLESILANLSAGVVAFDGEHRMLLANPGASRILGVDLSRLLDVPLPHWGQVDARLEAIARPLDEALSQPPGGDWERQITFPGEAGELTLLVRAGGIGPGGAVAVFDDITRLLAAQRQAAWGEVARRLAHEIKNPLTPIQLSAERLQQRLHPRLEAPEAEMLSRLTDTIVSQVTALKGMVDAFSLYARMPETKLETVELGALVREVLGLYEATGPRIALDIAPGTPPVLGDPAKLRQVIHNLLRNAEDAVAGVSLPRVKVSVEPAGDRVALRVADNGPGFPAELISRAFEPYVTTKPGGTGLGLAIVHKIVEEHRGSVRLENLPGGGARVSILLPAADTARDALPRVANG